MRYYPHGFVGTETAILAIAKARYPDKWVEASMSPEEVAVWDGINRTFDGTLLENALPSKVPGTERFATIDRLSSFEDAVVELRKALHAGTIVAQFCDESGQLDFIRSASWGGDGAVDALLSGVAWIDYGREEVNRLVLIPEGPLLALIGDPEAFATPLPGAEFAQASVGRVEPAGEAIQREVDLLVSPAANDPKRLVGMQKTVWDAMQEIWGGLPPSSVRPVIAEREIATHLRSRGTDIPTDLSRMVRHLRRKLGNSAT